MNSKRLSTGAYLGALEPRHAEEFAEHMDRAREHIRPWVGPSFVTTDVAGARATLERYAQRMAKDEARICGVWADGTLVGGVMLVDFSTAAGTCEIGCWSEPAGEGHGHITAAVRELLHYVFDVRGIHRAEWQCRADNARSIAVAQRLGMTFEGELRDAWRLDGTFYNKALWSILATDQAWAGRADITTD